MRRYLITVERSIIKENQTKTIILMRKKSVALKSTFLFVEIDNKT